MGSATGPRIHGIGRSGDSNIVLCMDAHDAGSYPGQPASNYVNSVVGEGAGVGPATPITLGEFGQLRNLVPIFETYGLVPYTMTMDVKTNIPGGVYVYMQNGSYTKYYFVGVSITCTTEYQRFTFANLTPSGPTSNWLTNTPTDDRAMLAMYTGYGSGINPTVKNIQIELGAYATPFVESRLIDPYAQGYTARPVSVNLMMSGNGFEDLSPSKHVITASGGATTGGPGKFSSTSLDFTASGSSFSIPSSEDFNLGTGDFTFDFWYNPPTVETYNYLLYIGNYNALFYFYNTSTSTSGYSLIHNNPSTWQNAINSGAVGGNNILAANEWQHIAFTRSGNTFRVFRNGILLATDTDSANITKDGAGIAQGAYGGTGINGYVDQYRITKGTALWTTAFTPPERRNRNAPVVDLSGSNNGGNFATTEMTDVATYRDGEVIEPVTSAVWDFDGTDDRIECSTGSFDLKCFELAIQQWQAVTPDGGMGVYYSNVGFTLNDYTGSSGNDLKNGLNIGGWTGGMTDETVSWWGYGTGGYWATYIKDTIPAGWHIYTFNWNGSSYDIWIDGAKKTTYHMTAPAALFQGVVKVSLGWNQGWNYYFKGKMGCVRCYDTSLTDQQIKQNFNAQRSRFGV